MFTQGLAARHCNIVIVPAIRRRRMESINSHVFNTLQAHGSVYVHCMAGVHRAPCMAAVLVGHADGLSSDDALRRIRSLRAVKPDEKVVERQGGEATSVWLHRITDSQPRPPVSVAHPLKLLASSRKGSGPLRPTHSLPAIGSRLRLIAEASSRKRFSGQMAFSLLSPCHSRGAAPACQCYRQVCRRPSWQAMRLSTADCSACMKEWTVTCISLLLV